MRKIYVNLREDFYFCKSVILQYFLLSKILVSSLKGIKMTKKIQIDIFRRFLKSLFTFNERGSTCFGWREECMSPWTKVGFYNGPWVVYLLKKETLKE